MIRPTGNRNANIAIVSDHVNSADIQFGRGYSGAEGQALLDPLMRLGYNTKTDLFLTHFNKHSVNSSSLIRCIKDKKDQKKDSGRVVQISTTDAFDVARSLLVAELKSLPNLKYIVVLGNEALYALTSYWGTAYRRGSIYEWDEDPTKLILTMENPRKWTGYRDLYGKYHQSDIIALRLGHKDLQKLKKGLYVTHPVCKVAPTVMECLDYIGKCREHGIFATDIECSRDSYEVEGHVVKNISCFSLAVNDNTAISIPILTSDGYPFYDKTSFGIIVEAYKKLCWDKTIIKVAQYTLFDTTVLAHDWGIRFRNLRDTMIHFAILYPEFAKGLDVITSICTNIPYYKDEGKSFINLNSTGESFWHYNAMDSAATIQSYFVLEQWVKRNGLKSTVDKQSHLLEPLLYMGLRGYNIDLEKRAKMTEEIRSEVASLTLELQKIAGYAINPNSSKQVMEFFYGKLGIKPYVKRSTGKATSDEEALKRLARRGIPGASILLDIRGKEKFANSYLEAKLDEDNRLHCQFKPVGTKSGRLSAGKTAYNTGQSLQTLPKRFKAVIKADPGCIIYNMDLSKAENMIVAHIAPDANMMHAFKHGIDLHSQTGALISGLSIAEVMRQDKEGITCKVGDGSHTWRYWGKKANHGLNYGEGAKAFALQNEIPEKESIYIIKKYMNVYPGVEQYHRWVKNLLERTRILTNLFDRKRVFLGRLDDTTFRDGYSFPPQSTVAEIINNFGINFIWDNRYGWARHIQLLNDVHDSIEFQIPISAGLSYHVNALILIKNSLETQLSWKGNNFIIPVECEAGVVLSELTKINLNQNKYNIKLKLKEITDELLDR